MKKHTSPLESIKRQYEAYGFTNFVDAAETHRKTLDPESFEHAILTFLLNHGVGLENAKSWKEISAHIRKQGHRITKNRFQIGLLQKSRRSLFYISSNNSGYFLCNRDSDVQANTSFYESRVAKERSHWDAILFLAARAKFVNPEADKAVSDEESPAA
jgi:hypothetical protein